MPLNPYDPSETEIAKPKSRKNLNLIILAMFLGGLIAITGLAILLLTPRRFTGEHRAPPVNKVVVP